MALICVPYLYYAISINLYANKNDPGGRRTPFPKFTDFWKVIVGAIVTQIVRVIIHNIMPGVFALYVKGDDEKTRQWYIRKSCKHFHLTLYFFCSAYWGWYVLRDCPYLYERLGGPPGGDLLKMKLDTIYWDYDQSILDYSLFTFGFHFGNFIQHLFLDERASDFQEMFIHHIAANCLYFCYIFSNFVPFGAVVAYLHDLADIPVNFGKVLSSTHFSNVTAFVGVVILTIWAYTRIYLLPIAVHFLFTH